MDKAYLNSEGKASRKEQRNRAQIAGNVLDFESGKRSQRQFAKEQGIPRTTLQHWLRRKRHLKTSPTLANFLESPEGVCFLHVLITAAHFVFTKLGIGSIHNVSEFLELCGLKPFVGTSYTTQQRASKRMDEKIIEFEAMHRPKLAEQMPEKTITLTEDETFHPEICMVAMEPVSNFIVAEKYTENREGATWNEVVKEGLRDLRVKVIQVSSDEGRGLLNHARKGLGVHHSPDCFHVSYEIGKGTSGALASRVRKAEKAHQSAVEQTQKREREQKHQKHVSDSLVGHQACEKNVKAAQELEKQAESEIQTAKNNQETVRQEKARIGEIYHPFNLETGEKQDAQQVSALLESCFTVICAAAEDLSEVCLERIRKAHRVVEGLVATIAFYFCMMAAHLDTMNLSEEERQLMETYLIPGYYLDQAGRKERNKVKKAAILEKSRALLSVVTQGDGVLSERAKEEMRRLVKAAKECAQIFQRSSSCVEGRNAQLSLRHHGVHKLSDRRLRAQTIVHNFYIRNALGTTPAQRFFEVPHEDLFAWLLDNMHYPVRPRIRPKKMTEYTEALTEAA